MAVFRVNKNKDYVVMSKYHFKEKDMSLKAIGMLSLMLSLPDDWNYSVTGLENIRCESKNSINSILNELEDFGYLKRTREYTNGKISNWIYDIYEKPLYRKNEDIENVDIEKLDIENVPQLNNKEVSNKQLNNNKHIYGEYKHVKLTDSELEKLKSEYSNYYDLITYLDEYIEMKGYKAKNHYLCIKKWVVNAVKEHSYKSNNNPEWIDKNIERDEMTDEECEKLRKELNL